MSESQKKLKQTSEKIILAAFANNQESSIFYRKYKKKCSVSNAVLKLLSTHSVDIISIRVINRRKQISLDNFIPDVEIVEEEE